MKACPNQGFRCLVRCSCCVAFSNVTHEEGSRHVPAICAQIDYTQAILSQYQAFIEMYVGVERHFHILCARIAILYIFAMIACQAALFCE